MPAAPSRFKRHHSRLADPPGAGSRGRLGRAWPFFSVWALCALLPAALPGRAAGDDLIEDAVPHGMVAFFAGESACPQGLIPTTEAAGRLVVPVVESAEVGAAIGTPLTDGEDRTHLHDYAGQLTLPYKSISAAAGDNKSGAAAGGATWGDKTAPAKSGLPFIQLLLCERP